MAAEFTFLAGDERIEVRTIALEDLTTEKKRRFRPTKFNGECEGWGFFRII